MPPPTHEELVGQLESATKGFDHLFANDMPQARAVFTAHDTPFHAMGLGICAFLEAALGMEAGLIAEAGRCLALAEAGAKQGAKAAKNAKVATRFAAGLEWEVLSADTIILSGVTNALSESYMGYLQCMYAMNSAHSKFSKLFKIVFPHGLDGYPTPYDPAPSSLPSSPLHHSPAPSPATPTFPLAPSGKGLLGRWSTPPSRARTPVQPDGPIEEAIVSGTAFGYGLFQLIFSLLPARARSVVGFFGFQHDRRLALQALAVSAAKNDAHSTFAGLALMSYHGLVLLFSGWQADEAAIISQYEAVVSRLDTKYPTGSLFILHRAKILRMAGDAEAAIKVLRDGLSPEKPTLFVQANALLVFELAWTLLGQREYQEAADMFIRMSEMNNWSKATYYFIAGGCYTALHNYVKAQEIFDALPGLLDKRKAGGKDLPTEVFIKKKVAFYKRKQMGLRGTEERWAECIKISPAEELGIFWNTHSRITKPVAETHVKEWLGLTPAVTVATPLAPSSPPTASAEVDLTTPDELALRALLLGVVHRALGMYGPGRLFLLEAHSGHAGVEVSTWIPGVAMFELAVLDLKEADAADAEGKETTGKEGEAEGKEGKGKEAGEKGRWQVVLGGASEKLDKAMALASNNVDLSSRLDMRISMLRDEIAAKKRLLGIA